MGEKNMAQEILILRSQRGWTQNELANRIRTTQRTVAAWEAGDSIPRKAMRVRIATAFDLPEDYFLADYEEEKEQPKESEIEHVTKLLDQLISSQESISEEKKAALMGSFTRILRK